jgi:2-hydroxychromene-2-carboxylate isomerase
MAIEVQSFTIYHSPNAYLGTRLLRTALAELDGITLVRRPIFVPRDRGVLIAEMLDGRENRNAAGYNREDCARWAARHGIPPLVYPAPGVFEQRAQRWALSAFSREELPARAFYAAPPEQQDALDDALFRAAWVERLDVNQHDTIRWAAAEAGLDGEELLAAAHAPEIALAAQEALEAFIAAECPGVPTVVVDRERFFGKDRVDWAREKCLALLRAATAKGVQSALE